MKILNYTLAVNGNHYIIDGVWAWHKRFLVKGPPNHAGVPRHTYHGSLIQIQSSNPPVLSNGDNVILYDNSGLQVDSGVIYDPAPKMNTYTIY